MIDELVGIRKEYERKVSLIEYDRTEVFREQQKLVEDLKEEVKKINVEYLSQLVFEIGSVAQMKTNVGNIYQDIEERVFKHLHTFSIEQLSLVKCGLTSVSPKYGSPHLHKAIDDLVAEHIQNHKLTLDQILHLYHAYRTHINKTFDSLFRNQLISAHNQVLHIFNHQTDPDVVPNVLYTYLNNRIRNAQRVKFREDNQDLDQLNLVFNTYLPLLNSSISTMTIRGLIRTLSVINLSKTDQLNVYSQIEHQLLTRIGITQLSNTELGLVIRYFGSGNGRQPYGSAQLY